MEHMLDVTKWRNKMEKGKYLDGLYSGVWEQFHDNGAIGRKQPFPKVYLPLFKITFLERSYEKADF